MFIFHPFKPIILSIYPTECIFIRAEFRLAFLYAMGYNEENTFKEEPKMENNEKIELYEEETRFELFTEVYSMFGT